MAINNQPRSFQQWAGVTATPPDFNLDAGVYGITLAAGGFTTMTLQKLLPDGITYASVSAALVPNSYTVLQLAAGQYKALQVGTAMNGEIALIARGGFR